MDSEVAGLRVQRKNKVTGTTISLYDGGPAGMDTFSGRWQTVCEDHSHIVSHATYKLARMWMSQPDQWCDACGTPEYLKQMNDLPSHRRISYSDWDAGETPESVHGPDNPTINIHGIEQLDSQFAMVEIRVYPDTQVFSNPTQVEDQVKAHLVSVGYNPAELAQDWEHQDGAAFQKWIIEG